MGPYDLSDEEAALIAYFRDCANDVGFDGDFSLPPVERGVVRLTGLVEARTLLKVFSALGLTGSAAWDLYHRMRYIEAPIDHETVQSSLQQIYRNK